MVASGTAIRLAALSRHNTSLMLREPGPVVSRLVMPLVMILLFRPLYLSALARHGVQAGTVQVVTGMLVMFSLLALSVVGTAILTERTWGTWDRLRATPVRSGELLATKALPGFGMLAVQQAEVLLFGVVAFIELPGFSGQGHIDLWDGGAPVGHAYWNAAEICFWALPVTDA